MNNTNKIKEYSNRYWLSMTDDDTKIVFRIIGENAIEITQFDKKEAQKLVKGLNNLIECLEEESD